MGVLAGPPNISTSRNRYTTHADLIGSPLKHLNIRKYIYIYILQFLHHLFYLCIGSVDPALHLNVVTYHSYVGQHCALCIIVLV